MLEEPVFIIFTLIAFSVLMAKLINVLRLGQFYDPEFILIGFIAHLLSFMFIFFMTLHTAATDASVISYLWGHILMLVITSILFLAEVMIFFVYLVPRKSGSEKYGERGRLQIGRDR